MRLNYFKLAALAFAAPLALAAPALSAQEIAGSGIMPGTAENSAPRAIGFASEAPVGAAMAIVMTGSQLPASISLSDADRAMAERRIAAREFAGKAGQSLELVTGEGVTRVVLVGAAADDGTAPDWRDVGGRIAKAMGEEKAPVAIVGVDDPSAMAEIAFGASLGQYRFDRYKSGRKNPPAQTMTLVGSGSAAARALWQSRHAPLAEGVALARDLVNEPANVIYPESFVERARAAFRGVPNVTIKVLDQADMRRLGMGAIAGVGQGSPRGSRLMMITYKGADGSPIALAGKGITFDTGGISLKQNPGM